MDGVVEGSVRQSKVGSQSLVGYPLDCIFRTSKIMSVGISSIPLSLPLSRSSSDSPPLLRRVLTALLAGLAVASFTSAGFRAVARFTLLGGMLVEIKCSTIA